MGLRTLLSLWFVALAVLGAFLVPVGPVSGLEQTATDNWAPVGPFIDEVLVKVLSSPFEFFSALCLKDIDLADRPLTKADLIQIPECPGVAVSPPAAEFGFFDLEFNNANTHFGIPFDFGNSPAGIHLRHALAHLIDKKTHTANVLEGLGVPIDNPVSPSQSVPEPDFHLYDSLHGPQTISSFNLADDTLPAPAVDSPDWVAAKEHLLAAGFTESAILTPSGYKLLDPPVGTVDFYVRSDDPGRLALGNNLASAWNSLFVGGAGGLNIKHCDIYACFPVVFETTTVLDWHWYTGGWRIGPTWGHLFEFYHSQLASNQCGGRKTRVADNYQFICISALDDKLAGTPYETGGVMFSPDAATSLMKATEALLIFGQHEPTIPVWTRANRFGYLAGWKDIINANGDGPPNFYTLLNAVCGSSVGTVCPGGADSAPGRLRWGFSKGTSTLNVFGAYTFWEFLILDEIYDSLVSVNPMNPTQLISNMANEWRVFLDGAGLGYTPPAGTKTSIRYQLRPNVFFHDGTTRLTAKDVRFTFINFRDIQAFPPAPLSSLIDATVLNPTLVDVHLNAKGPFLERGVGLLPILNSNVWDRDGNGYLDTGKETEDVVASGLLAKDGSGPYVFVSTTGGDGLILPGDTVLLKRFGPAGQSAAANQYHRASGVYKNLAWTDINDGAALKVDIIDIASIALCFGKPATGSCTYWDTVAGGIGEGGHTPLQGTVPNVVDIIEFGAVASNFGQRWLFPANWSPIYDGIRSFPFVPPGP